ncbi:MAG TPA: anti-sigma factor [Candidatus Hydrogenedentes bacterium]|nr:anti-sigma factor [Candidatus Hydrogenedentota bacterium]
MECRTIQSRFTGYLDGDLRPAERRRVEAHIAECPACQEEFAHAKHFLQDCHEFLVCPGPAYSFETLRTRMAAIEPIQEIVAFLPKLRINAFIPRFAVALLALTLIAGPPYALRNSRQVYSTIKLSFHDHAAQWDDNYQTQLDDEYRSQFTPPNA